MMVHAKDKGDRSQGLADGSASRGGVLVSEAGGEDMGYSTPEVAELIRPNGIGVLRVS